MAAGIPRNSIHARYKVYRRMPVPQQPELAQSHHGPRRNGSSISRPRNISLCFGVLVWQVSLGLQKSSKVRINAILKITSIGRRPAASVTKVDYDASSWVQFAVAVPET